MKDQKTFNYDEALQELQILLKEIDQDDIKMEEFQKKVNRAKKLVEKCKNRLRNIQENLSKTTE